jgi:hypothetical protein
MKKSAAPKNAVSSVEASPKKAVSRRHTGVSKACLRRSDGADAFLRSHEADASYTRVDLAEDMAEGFVGSATSGEDQRLEIRDRVMDEEMGGPFVMTPAKREFAEGIDPSNPEDSEREPFPTVTGQGDLAFESEPEL